MSRAIARPPADALAAVPSDDDKLAQWCARPDVIQRFDDALGGYFKVGEFVAHMTIFIQSRPELANCSVASQYEAMHRCAMLGLLPGLQQVALIPRAGKIDVMTQWQGYKALFERVPEVFEVQGGIVHNNDVFEVAGDWPEIVVVAHQFNPFDANRKIERLPDIRGTYAKFTFRDGRAPRYHFAPAHYISKCRDVAQTKNVWDKWFEQMAIKTAFRSAYSRRVINVDPIVAGRLERFLAHEDALLGNDPRMVVDAAPAQPLTIPQSRSSVLAEQLRRPVSQPEPMIPLPPEPVPEAAVVESESSEPAAEQAAGQQVESGKVADFLLMMSTCKGDAQLESLYDSWCGPDAKEELTDAERSSISTAVEEERQRRRDAKKQRGQQGRLV